MTTDNLCLVNERNKIIDFINNNNVEGLKDFINSNEFKLNSLNIPTKFDILIYAIENNASFQMVQYIMEECHYETLNYWVLNEEIGRKSPLLSSLFKNDFTLANYLLEHGATMKYQLCYFDVIYYLDGNNKLNKDNLRYILRNGYDIKMIEPYYICCFIERNQADFINIIFNETIFTNDIIFQLLNFYNNKTSVSDKTIKDLVEGEMNKIRIQKRYYETAVDTDNYKAFEVLYKNDFRDHKVILDELLEIFNAYDRIHHSNKKYKFLKKIKDNELAIEIEAELLDSINILDVEETREEIVKIIKNGDEKELVNYVKSKKVYLPDVNSEEFDLIICGLEHSMSKEMFVALAQNGQYSNFDYHIKEGDGFTTPIIKALEKEAFEIADLLFALGINPNYNIRAYIPVDLGHKKVNCLNLYLFRKNMLTPNIFKYLITSRYSGHLYINIFIIDSYVRGARSDLLEILFNSFKLSTIINPKWYIIALHNKDYETINIIYENDNVNDAKSVGKFLMTDLMNRMLLGQVSYESKKELVDHIKDQELKEVIENSVKISFIG